MAKMGRAKSHKDNDLFMMTGGSNDMFIKVYYVYRTRQLVALLTDMTHDNCGQR